MRSIEASGAAACKTAYTMSIQIKLPAHGDDHVIKTVQKNIYEIRISIKAHTYKTFKLSNRYYTDR